MPNANSTICPIKKEGTLYRVSVDPPDRTGPTTKALPDWLGAILGGLLWDEDDDQSLWSYVDPESGDITIIVQLASELIDDCALTVALVVAKRHDLAPWSVTSVLSGYSWADGCDLDQLRPLLPAFPALATATMLALRYDQAWMLMRRQAIEDLAGWVGDDSGPIRLN